MSTIHSGDIYGRTNIKSQVKERYGAIASLGGCGCSPNCCSPDSGTIFSLINYQAADLLPLADSDLGLGCGTPTRYATLQPGEVVLDLGSGAGIDVFLAARQVGASGKVIGVDMTPAMIERARLNAVKAGVENVEFRLGEIEHLPVESDSVDVVLSKRVINLVPDKTAAFAEIRRALKPGGRFIISDMVTTGDVPDELRQDLTLWAGCISGALDREDYLALVRAAGFVDLKIHTQTDYPGGEGTPLPDGAEFGLASLTLAARKA